MRQPQGCGSAQAQAFLTRPSDSPKHLEGKCGSPWTWIVCVGIRPISHHPRNGEVPSLSLLRLLLCAATSSITANDSLPTLLVLLSLHHYHPNWKLRRNVDITSHEIEERSDMAVRDEVEPVAGVVPGAPTVTINVGLVGTVGEDIVCERRVRQEIQVNRVISGLVEANKDFDGFHGNDTFLAVRVNEDGGTAILATQVSSRFGVERGVDRIDIGDGNDGAASRIVRHFDGKQ
ncbi:hypothetical protein R3P38DRAFT_3092816 [Favolaschia claudopus]|uniref:Uncharacterized protein n=1 Tax=Favolaschia claudopus TaxID=2862362 RepID=A0AAV9ZR98_9AGAR